MFRPSPLQKPRIPIWIGGFWPHKAPFNRAAKWDGAIPLRAPGRLAEPADIREVARYVRDRRKSSPDFDIANIGWSSGANRTKDHEKVMRYVDAGTTWWLESLWTKRDNPGKMLARIRKGPPD